MLKENTVSDKRYIKVVSGGGFAERVSEDTPGAVKREWTVPARGNEPAKSGVVFEKLYTSVSGRISRVVINDGDFGSSLLVGISDGVDNVTVTMGLDSEFGQDFLHKAANIDPNEEVVLNAWAIENDAGKTKRGLSVKQDGEKIYSAFVEYNPDTKESTHTLGYPEVPKGNMTTDKWKLYFMNTRVWLRDYIEDNGVLDKFNSNSSSDTVVEDFDENEPIDLSEIPF